MWFCLITHCNGLRNGMLGIRSHWLRADHSCSATSQHRNIDDRPIHHSSERSARLLNLPQTSLLTQIRIETNGMKIPFSRVSGLCVLNDGMSFALSFLSSRNTEADCGTLPFGNGRWPPESPRGATMNMYKWTTAMAFLTLPALGLSGCADSPADRQAHEVRKQTDQHADEVRNQHDAAADQVENAANRDAESIRNADGKTITGEAKTRSGEDAADAVEKAGADKADAIRDAGERKADAIEKAGERKADEIERRD